MWFTDLRQISIFHRKFANICGRKLGSQIRKQKLESAICGFAEVPTSGINARLAQLKRSKNGFSPEAFLESSTSAQNFSVFCFQPKIMFEKYQINSLIQY